MFVLIWVTLVVRVRSNSANSDLCKKPSVMIPLTEGQQVTLTCTAPGRCSGSDPELKWMWKRVELNNSYTTANLSQKSDWTFKPSAEHHNTAVTCRVNCTTEEEETVTLQVNYVKKPEITGRTTISEGDALNLTCTVDSFPPSVVTWTKHGMNNSLINETGPDFNNNTGTSTLIIQNATAEDSGQYSCMAKHLNTLMQDINMTIIYEKKPEITGETTVEEAHVLNLTCTADSLPQALITWTTSDINTTLSNGTGAATRVVYNVTSEHSGLFTAENMNSLTETVDVTVKVLPKILTGSECKVQSEVLTCVCVSQGFPLPSIKWPLMENLSEYSVLTTVSNHTINSTINLSLKGGSSTSPVCVIHNENGEIKRNLNVNKGAGEGGIKKLLRIVTRLETIIPFLFGTALSAVIFCVVCICCRKKKKRNRGNLDDKLEMVMVQEDPMMDDGQEVEEDQIQDQETLDGAEAVAAAGKSDVDYSNIDFSLLKRKSPAEARTTETDYAEIKREAAEEGPDGEGKEEEELLGEDEETRHCAPEEEDGEDVAVYSSVQDIMG